MSKSTNDDQINRLVRRHLLVGWSGLLFFLFLGIGLEAFHGLKLGYYLDVRHESRRLMWTLAHSHGTLFSVINIAFALTISLVARSREKTLRFVSGMLIGAIVLMPAGFFLGGLWLLGSEPGVGVFLVPIGALMMLFAVCGVLHYLARSGSHHASESQENPDVDKTRKKVRRRRQL